MATPRPSELGTRLRFAFDPLYLPASAAFGITPITAWADVADGFLDVRFGLWRLRSPLDNVEGVTATGPYHWFKVIGPPHVSLADGGLTFATNARRGLCIRFRSPVPAILPVDVVRHPAVTLTVSDLPRLAAALEGSAESPE